MMILSNSEGRKLLICASLVNDDSAQNLQLRDTTAVGRCECREKRRHSGLKRHRRDDCGCQ